MFGGGNKAAVVGTDTVNIRQSQSYVNNVFGGGNEAGTTNAVVNILDGTVHSGVYGGCNSDGTVTGDIYVNVFGGTLGTSTTAMEKGIFGGGYGDATKTTGDVNLTIGDATYAPTIYADVYGGSALGDVHAENTTTNKTTIDFNKGTIHGDLYGGGLGDQTYSAIENGAIEVNLKGGTVDGNIYGANNIKGAPQGAVAVNVSSGSANNVFGGGNVANYGGTSSINMTGGTVNNVYGGGNQANVGGSNINITNGTINQDVFGGGYGAGTSVDGDVMVSFGAESATHNTALTVRDIYGGSALGNVNTDANNSTTVNVLNGKVNGNVYGGGLGNTGNAAAVNGKVYVNIGKKLADKSLVGQADLSASSVFGCNNTNGSPKDDVFINVYQTYRRATDEYNYDPAQNNNVAATYAINQVFGGGNNAHYLPLGDHAVTTTIDSCFNSIRRVFGGGNAADLGFNPAKSDTTKLIDKVVIDGGRFDYIFAGGNGELDNTESNIWGCVDLTISGGYVGQFFGGSNRHGITHGTSVINTEPGACTLEIDNFFCGGNYTDVHGNVETTITCGSDMHVNHLYGGCNLANIYGHVKLTIEGGEFIDVYGGSKGSATITPFIRDYIELNLKGGTIDNAFGGCDVNGTVNNVNPNPVNPTNSIAVNIEDAEATNCELILHNVYGGGDKTTYIGNPIINILKGTISKKADGTGGNVFGGGHKGDVTGNPTIYLGVKNDNTKAAKVEGNVYGGGDEANVTGTTNVILQGNTEVEGNVYGGGHQGDVNGSTNVTIVPED